jgi:transposase
MPKPTTDLPSTEVKPDPMSERRTRRTFKRDYKLNIIRKADACEHGELGALLRKENLYSNQLSQWRRELTAGGADALAKSAPGPAPKLSAEQKRTAHLQKQVAKLEKQLEIKDQCIELQKKVLGMIEQIEQGGMS